MVNRQDINGLNNIFKIELDEAKQTLTVWSQGNGKSVLPWLPGPTVVQIPIAKAPTSPAGMKATCMTGPYSPTPDGVGTTCPVRVDNGVAFWPFSYLDNRVSIGWVGYNTANEKVSVLELPGTRYTWNATIDRSKNTVVYSGQSAIGLSLPWSELT